MSRIFFIGDVHGCSGALNALIDALSPTKGDQFAFLGDLVDKGPDSLGVLRQVRELMEEHPGSSCLLGNHEDSALALQAKAIKAGTWQGLKKVEKEQWLLSATESDFDFMRSLPLYARPMGDKSILTVHGGLFPAYFEKYSGLPELTPNWRKGGGKQMDRARRFLRIRHVYVETGDMVTLGDEGKGSGTVHWSDWYDGREGFVFYGHHPTTDDLPRIKEHSMGLDTGAVFGGKLTAAVLHPGQHPRDAQIISTSSVKCAERYVADDE